MRNTSIAPAYGNHASGHMLRGIARKVEIAMMTLLMTGVVAAFLWMVSFSMAQADDARDLAEAVAMAETMAEEFCSDPSGMRGERIDARYGLSGECVVTQESVGRGVLYHALISVVRVSDGHEVYSLESA